MSCPRTSGEQECSPYTSNLRPVRAIVALYEGWFARQAPAQLYSRFGFRHYCEPLIAPYLLAN